MFRHQIRNSLLAVLAVFLLALSGCGGGGGGTAEVPPPMMECPQGQVGTYPDCMDPPPTAEERIAAAQGRADTAATNARADANAAAMLDHQDDTDVAAAVKAAEDAASAAELAKDLADAATNPDAAEALATQAETAEGNADTALGNARTASSAAQTAMETAASVAATTKAAGTKAKAIKAEAAQMTDANLGGTARSDTDGTTTADDASDDPYTLAVSRDSMGTTVKITDPNATGDDDPKFTQAMDLGGGTTMHTRKMKADSKGNVVEEVVIVSTDIEAPTAVAFAKFEDAAGAMTQGLDVRKDGQAVSTDNVADSRDISAAALDAATPADKAVIDLVESSSFVSGGQATLTFPVDDATTLDKNEAFVAAGTYNGAMGMYMCSGTTPCTVSFDAKGAISGMSDGWIFTPAEGATSDQPDYDYVSYGFWLKKTMDAMEVVTYNEVETFAEASRDASGDVSLVEGSATYKGGATGVYVKNVLTPEGVIDRATAGHFTADATLTAIFGQLGEDPEEAVAEGTNPGTFAPNALNTLTGTINNFRLSGNEDNMWSVALEGDITATAGTASGTAKGGVEDQDGSFSATFHGAAATTTRPHTMPSAVIGEFNSVFSDGSVAGAFGAQVPPKE